MDDFTQQTLHCPSCSEPMHSLELQRRAVGKLRIDLCFGCCLIWFDQNESAQLAPAAVIELFQQINSHRDARRMPVAAALPCPRCTQRLLVTHDLCKSGPLQYFRCSEDGGRLTPFFQFLREKQFLRALTPAEMHRVRVEVKQLQCSNCGAPVDLEESTSCPYCASPISMIDTDAVRDAMQMWSAQATRERAAEAEASARARPLYETGSLQPQPTSALLSNLDPITGIAAGSDLVQVCIEALGDFLTSD